MFLKENLMLNDYNITILKYFLINRKEILKKNINYNLEKFGVKIKKL